MGSEVQPPAVILVGMPRNASDGRPWSAAPKRLAQRALKAFDLRLVRLGTPGLEDLSDADRRLYDEVKEFTMTSAEAVFALTSAVRHVVAAKVPGAIVECGVWRGGSMMAVARTLADLGRTDIPLYLFDTFEGMPEPSDEDVLWTGESAKELLATETGRSAELLWAEASLDDVRRTMERTGYPSHLIRYVEGKVQDTLPAGAPDSIALLRLDTDWYESSKHELEHLYPRLSSGGVLILDDYGWWNGVRKATDEYFAAHPPAPLLIRLDSSGARIGVKP
jgi:O-methyltransferase